MEIREDRECAGNAVDGHFSTAPFSMSYQIFARKYRPQSFDEVIGQDVTVITLSNAINNARLHQAYLFCGARGVGKTSLARIFAKSINCEKGPTTQPCQKCTSCIGIAQSSYMDVLEIDGASNTGVDDVRELREQAKYLPSSGKYKMYIIDEVHMLSQSAFNALLKILEEPPPHLIFIFATTEPHKIPVTILSRCQRYDFNRLSPSLLTQHLQSILKKENLTLDDESLNLIAHCADGSVRDSLSLLDQVISFCGSHAKPDKVREILGLTNRALLFEMLQSLLDGDIPSALKKTEDIYNKGYDLKIFSENLLELTRHLLVITEGGIDLIHVSPGEKERLQKMATLLSSSHYLLWFQILSRGTVEIAQSEFPRLCFETTLIKMVKAQDLISIPELIEKLGTEKRPETNQRLQTTNYKLQTKPVLNKAKEPQNPNDRTTERGHERTIQRPNDSTINWTNFVKKVVESKPQIGSILEHARPLKIGEGLISLGFEAKSIYADMIQDRLHTIRDLAQSFFKKEMKLDIQTIKDQTPLPSSALEVRQEKEQQRAKQITEKALSSPGVKKAQEILGAKVKEVKVK